MNLEWIQEYIKCKIKLSLILVLHLNAVHYTDVHGVGQTATSTGTLHVAGLSLTNFTDAGPFNNDYISTDRDFDLAAVIINDGLNATISASYQQSINGGGSWNNLVGSSVANLSDGTYQFRALVTENGVTSTTNALTVVVDNVAPTGYSIASTSFNASVAGVLRNFTGTSSSLAINPNATTGEVLQVTMASALATNDVVQYSLDGNTWLNTTKLDSTHANITGYDFTGTELLSFRVADLAGNTPQILNSLVLSTVL